MSKHDTVVTSDSCTSSMTFSCKSLNFHTKWYTKLCLEKLRITKSNFQFIKKQQKKTLALKGSAAASSTGKIMKDGLHVCSNKDKIFYKMIYLNFAFRSSQSCIIALQTYTCEKATSKNKCFYIYYFS